MYITYKLPNTINMQTMMKFEKTMDEFMSLGMSLRASFNQFKVEYIREVLSCVCDEYNLEQEDVFSKYAPFTPEELKKLDDSPPPVKIVTEKKMCSAVTKKGSACPHKALSGAEFCKRHGETTVKNAPKVTCKGKTAKGTPCTFKCCEGSEFCKKHAKQNKVEKEPEVEKVEVEKEPEVEKMKETSSPKRKVLEEEEIIDDMPMMGSVPKVNKKMRLPKKIEEDVEETVVENDEDEDPEESDYEYDMEETFEDDDDDSTEDMNEEEQEDEDDDTEC